MKRLLGLMAILATTVALSACASAPAGCCAGMHQEGSKPMTCEMCDKCEKCKKMKEGAAKPGAPEHQH